MTLPLYVSEYDRTNKLDCYVDWGDGTKDYVTTNNPSHTYSGLAEAKRFVVKVNGNVPALSSENLSPAQKNGIRAVKQWGMTGLKSMANAFDGCANLESVAADNTMAFMDVEIFEKSFSDCVNLTSNGLSANLFEYAINATDFDYVFSNCSSLTEIPEDLFKNNVKVTSFDYAFAETSISTISEGLFVNCPDVESFSHTFEGCKFLTAIPEDLFANCCRVLSFWSVFYACDGLTTIPENLFANCPEVTNFQYAFGNCKNITMVPVNIFDYNRKVDNFQHVFSVCYKITGESPYTIINGEKVHLYERKNYGEEFVSPTSYGSAFLRCDLLTDYANIPADWK